MKCSACEAEANALITDSRTTITYYYCSKDISEIEIALSEPMVVK